MGNHYHLEDNDFQFLVVAAFSAFFLIFTETTDQTSLKCSSLASQHLRISTVIMNEVKIFFLAPHLVLPSHESNGEPFSQQKWRFSIGTFELPPANHLCYSIQLEWCILTNLLLLVANKCFGFPSRFLPSARFKNRFPQGFQFNLCHPDERSSFLVRCSIREEDTPVLGFVPYLPSIDSYASCSKH